MPTVTVSADPNWPWQPIETAPKDGTDILIVMSPDLDPEGEGLWAVARWDSERSTWMPWWDAPYGNDPTRRHDWPSHWMRLPDCPAAVLDEDR